jgi:hypothetical protein
VYRIAGAPIDARLRRSSQSRPTEAGERGLAHRLEMDRRMKTLQKTLALTTILIAACGGIEEDFDQEWAGDVGQEESELLGSLSFDPFSCSAQEQAFLTRIHQYTRVASYTLAFYQCLDTSMRRGHTLVTSEGSIQSGPHQPYLGEPHQNASIDTRIARLWDITHTQNNVSFTCDGTSGGNFAEAYPVNSQNYAASYGHTFVEAQHWQDVGQYANMSFSAVPTGIIATYANTILHEIIHTHGYLHAAASTSPNVHVYAPYIVGDCIEAVLRRSFSRCGSSLEVAGQSGLRMITSFDSSTCTQIPDPRDFAPSRWFDSRPSDGVNLDVNTVSMGEANRVAQGFCSARGYPAGFFNGHQTATGLRGVVCLAGAARPIAATQAMVNGTAWSFNDVRTVHWARAGRAAHDLCVQRGYVGGAFDGQGGPGFPGTLVCFASTRSRWFDVLSTELGPTGYPFTDVNATAWAHAGRAAATLCWNRGYVGGRFNGHQIPGHYGLICWN